MHVSDDVIPFFSMCLSKGAMDGSGCLMAAFFMYRNQGFPHGVRGVAMSDIDELIGCDTLSNKDFSKVVIKKPCLVIFGLYISIGHWKCPIDNGEEFTEFKESHDFFLPLSPIVIQEFLGD